MNLTDEQLSAFLDAELPEAEMELIREQLIEDETLANRLADLAMVDELVAKAYSTIDAQPMPAAITALLTKPAPNNLVQFPLWKRVGRSLQQHAAIAAGVMLLVGFGTAQLLAPQHDSHWQSVAQVLETQPSGIEQVSKGMHIKPRATFTDKSGHYCRQFELSDNKGASENIACRRQGEWQLTASVALEKIAETGTYQTASGNSSLDDALENMAASEFFDAQTEAAAIGAGWSAHTK